MKKKQIEIALEICAKTFDISKKEIKEIVSEPKKVYANISIKHTFRAVMAKLTEAYKKEGKHCYTLEEIAGIEQRYGSSAHCNVLESKKMFNDAVKNKGKDGYTINFKTANYFLKEYLK